MPLAGRIVSFSGLHVATSIEIAQHLIRSAKTGLRVAQVNNRAPTVCVINGIYAALTACASRILGGARVLCFVKRIQRSRSAAGISQPVGLAGVADGRTHRQPASQRAILRFHCNRTRHTPCRPVITLPDVRTDDEDRQLAAARPPAQAPALAPTDSPACPFPATGASESR